MTILWRHPGNGRGWPRPSTSNPADPYDALIEVLDRGRISEVFDPDRPSMV
jgi:hypothetical protein